MTIYNVHIYREMRLDYINIEAETPETAAQIARDLAERGEQPMAEECHGETFTALVDVADDEEFSQSRTIDFEGERLSSAAPKLLHCLKTILAAFNEAASDNTRSNALIALFGNHSDSIRDALLWRQDTRAAIAKATGGAA